MGSNSGSGITSGSENVCLGHDAGATQIGDNIIVIDFILPEEMLQYNLQIHGDQHGRCYMGSNDSSWIQLRIKD